MASSSDFFIPPNDRWLQLRVMEWGQWPIYISQSLAPVLLVFFPWREVVGLLFAADLVWILFVRYSFVNLYLSKLGVAVATLRYITWPAATFYLFYKEMSPEKWISLGWPAIVFLSTALIPTDTDRIKLRFLMGSVLKREVPRNPANILYRVSNWKELFRLALMWAVIWGCIGTYQSYRISTVRYLSLVDPSVGIAPDAALEYLKEHPDTVQQFKDTFGFRPAPRAAFERLRDQPETGRDFVEYFGIAPAPIEAIERLHEHPEMRGDFQEMYGYQPLSQRAIDYLYHPVAVIWGNAAGGLLGSIPVLWLMNRRRMKARQQTTVPDASGS